MEQGIGAKAANDDLRWYALRVRSGKEKLVQDSLAMIRVENRLPLQTVLRRKNRRRDKPKKIQIPLMVGYVFVGFGPGPIEWRRVLAIHNILAPVYYIDANGDRRYAKMPKTWEDDLNPDFLDPRADRPLNPAEIFGPGDQVTFRAGGFMGVKGHVIDLDAAEARILLELFKSTRVVRAPINAIKKAA